MVSLPVAYSELISLPCACSPSVLHTLTRALQPVLMHENCSSSCVSSAKHKMYVSQVCYVSCHWLAFPSVPVEESPCQCARAGLSRENWPAPGCEISGAFHC